MTETNRLLPVAREGWPFIIPSLVLAVILVLAFGRPALWPAFPLAIFGLFSLWFFRDPERQSPPEESAVLSPADGTIIIAEEVDEDRFLDRRSIKISIFMSIFNVHVNRVPLTGRVEQVSYFAGRFLRANLDKASKDNEHNVILLKNPAGIRILVVQIAGLIARRIACWVKAGDEVQRGRRFGLIRFGSRLDVYLPVGTRIEVQIGQKVKAGVTILGVLSGNKEDRHG